MAPIFLNVGVEGAKKYIFGFDTCKKVRCSTSNHQIISKNEYLMRHLHVIILVYCNSARVLKNIRA